MKKYLLVLLLAAVSVGVHAQPGGGGAMAPGGGPKFSKSMAKLFGSTTAFSSNIETQIGEGSTAMTMKGKMALSDLKSRFEMDMTQAKGPMISPEAIANMKMMGMDKMISISRPDKKVAYLVYPGMEAYVEMPQPDADATDTEPKIEKTELGKETVDGHPCIKNKVIVTDDKGNKHESTTWNATDLKDFPVKIQQTEEGKQMTISFKDIKTDKPDASLFDPPAGLKKYENMMTMMQETMSKRMGDKGFAPPPAPGK